MLVAFWPLASNAARGPGLDDRGFENAQDAFVAVFIDSGLGRRAYEENREYAAALYQMPDGRWHATPVSTGDLKSCRIPYDKVPDGAVRIAGAHTHGQPRIAGEGKQEFGTGFSTIDRRNALLSYRVTHGRVESQWLLTSHLQILELSFAMAYSPADSRIGVQSRIRDLGLSERFARHSADTGPLATSR